MQYGIFFALFYQKKLAERGGSQCALKFADFKTNAYRQTTLRPKPGGIAGIEEELHELVDYFRGPELGVGVCKVGLVVVLPVARCARLSPTPIQPVRPGGSAISPEIWPPRCPRGGAVVVVQVPSDRVNSCVPDLIDLCLNKPFRGESILIRVRLWIERDQSVTGIDASGEEYLLQVGIPTPGGTNGLAQLRFIVAGFDGSGGKDVASGRADQ